MVTVGWQICEMVRKFSSLTSKFAPHKMVFVVPQDVSMGKGKLSAQCAHAAICAYKQSSAFNIKVWEIGGQQKVVLKCADTTELLKLYENAKALKLVATLIQDAGRTQVKAGTYTVLALGPSTCEQIDSITGHLKLL